MPTLLETAQQLAQNGISVVATRTDKIPVGGKWGHLQKQIASHDELLRMFSNPLAKSIATIGGRVSGNLYTVDFEGKDYQHQPMESVYPQWIELVKLELSRYGPDQLFEKLVVTKTQNGGYHVRWRVETAEKLSTEPLAKSPVINPETGESLVDEKGKPVTNLLIEAKAEGGLTLCPPSPGYKLIQGDMFAIPTLPLDIHKRLVAVAKSFHAVLNDVFSRSEQSRTKPETDGQRPGDEFNQRGDHRSLLDNAGWKLDHTQGEVEYWRRPGKDEGCSATWGHIPDRLYVFSTNADPFENNRTYDRFSIYAYIKHDGDFERAARDLAEQGYGSASRTQSNHQSSKAGDEDKILAAIRDDIEKAATISDRLEQTKRVKAIIDRLVELSPIDQSMFIDKMKQLRLGSKGALEAQLKEAIQAKKQQGPKSAPSDHLHEDGDVRSAHGVYEGQHHYYKLAWDANTKTYYPLPISSFVIQPNMRVWLDNKENLTVDIVTQEKSYSNVTIHRRDWNSNERFKDTLPSIDLSWFGNTNDVEAVKTIVAEYDIPVKQGTDKLGLHPGGIWVLPDGVITEDGWCTDPALVYLPRGGHGELDNQLTYPALDDEDWHHLCQALYNNLLDLNTLTVMVPVIGWFLAAPFTPLLRQRNYPMPHLSMWGTRGAGKSTLMRLMWKLSGHIGEGNDTLFSCTETDFVMLKLLSSTTSIPIVLDEYKPYDMPPQRLKTLTRMFRKAYDGETEFRGRANQTTVEYTLTAPIVLAGEVALTEGASLERILSVEMSPNVLTPGMRKAYQNLWHLPLQAFCRRYIPFVIRTNVVTELQRAKETMRRIVDLGSLPDRVGKNLTVMVFGFQQFLRFGVEQGILNANENWFGLIAEAVLAMRNAVCGSDGVTRVALDYLVEHLAVMAETKRIQHGRDYVIREVHNDIAIRFDSCFAEFRKYVRETQLDGEILNAQAYRKQIKENHDRGGYIVETSVNVRFGTLQKRSVVISPERAMALDMDLSGFFGNEPDD